MGTYELDTVIKKWKRGDLTVEQAVGQMLQLLELMSHRIGRLERSDVRERPLTEPPQPGKQGDAGEGSSK